MEFRLHHYLVQILVTTLSHARELRTSSTVHFRRLKRTDSCPRLFSPADLIGILVLILILEILVIHYLFRLTLLSYLA